MSNDDATHEGPTRREYVKYGGAVAVGGMLAGCAGQSGEESTPGDTTETDTSAESTQEDTTYEACIEPNGCYTFDEVPESIVTYEQDVTDMLIALDRTDELVATAVPDRYPTGFIDQLPDVSFDPESVEDAVGVAGKESFYEWDADIHILDHRNAMSRFDLSRDDIDELEENVGPFYGTYLRRPDYDGGVHYGLYEGFKKVAEACRARPNAEALSELHADLVEQIRTELPPVSERPSVAYLTPTDDSIFVWELGLRGTQYGAFRDLEIEQHNAFEGYHEDSDDVFIQADTELLLEADPDVIILHGGLGDIIDPEGDYEATVEPLTDDSVANQVTAVQEDRIYPIHLSLQGPITRMFITELFAKVLYPDRFGEHPHAEPPYENLMEPLPEADQLFDRQQLADIINGDI